MRIVKSNLKNNELVIAITNPEDFWYLSHIIDKGDSITARTLRKIKLGNGDERSQSIIKKPVVLEIEAEKNEVTENSLRVSGRIMSDAEDIKKGSYHTITLEINSVATIRKKKWMKFQLEKIKESSMKQANVLIIALERDNASFALLKKYGFEKLLDIEGNVEKKAMKENLKNTFYADVIIKIREYCERYGIQKIVVASPAFWKDELLKEIKDKEILNKIVTATCHSTGNEGINEIINRDEVKNILKEERMVQETRKVEELMKEVAKNNLAAYGMKQVKEAATNGSVKELLISDDAVRRFKEENKYDEIDEIMSAVEDAGGDVYIISIEHEAGKRLNGLGGVAAILRYKTYT